MYVNRLLSENYSSVGIIKNIIYYKYNANECICDTSWTEEEKTRGVRDIV